MRIDYEGGADKLEEFEFVHDRLYALFVHYSCFEHFLHGEFGVGAASES